MNKKILLRGKESFDYLEITLTDIISLLDNGSLYSWKILWVEINVIKFDKFKIGNKSYTYETFHKVINDNTTEGLLINWEELCKLDEWVFQFIDLLIIGDRNIENLQRYNNDPKEIINNCQYLIELFDSSFWEISSMDVIFIDRVSQALL